MSALPTTFDTVTMEAIAPVGTVFSVDVEKRVIRGLVMPFGVEGLKDGKRFSFSKGTIRGLDNPARVKLWIGHDKTTACGVAFELTETDEGLEGAFRVARGARGDEALSMAEDGVWDGFSLGPSEGAKYQLRGGIYHSADIPIHEISLTPAPVFGGARVRSVAFDAGKENSMKCTKCGVVHADGVTECKAEDVPAFEAAQTGPTFDMTGLVEPLTEALTEAFSNLTDPQGGGGRERISATDGLEINEPSPYRFDGLPAEHSFVQDLQEQNRDSEARQRLEGFVEDLEKFAVSTTNVAGLNPIQQRPDLYVPNLTFTRPLWELVSTGVITDKTKFNVPKFSSASGLVGAHTEGVEPTPGAFAATTQEVAPGAKSGKIEINREAWDQGGSPQADGIIWAEMLNGWYEAIEVDIATTLAAVGTAELNLAGAVDAALSTALTNYLAGLQFVRGGNRFTAFAADGNLFPALVAAKDGDGRPLFPVIGPANAQGTTATGFDRVQIGSQTIRAAWALGTGNDKKSYNFVPGMVWAWASAPKRFTFEYQVKSVDMAIWGYTASAVLRASDVKPVDYTTSDTP